MLTMNITRATSIVATCVYISTTLSATAEGLSLFPNERESDRRLQAAPCPVDPNLKKDAVWYELGLVLTSTTNIDCHEDEWEEVRITLDDELGGIDLYGNYSIYDLNQDICNVNPVPTRRLARLDPDDGTVLDYLSDEDLAKMDPNELQRNLDVDVIAVIFHMFYRGGGKCWFCGEDNGDTNSRALSGNPPLEGNSNDNNHSLRGSIGDAFKAMIPSSQIKRSAQEGSTTDFRRRAFWCGGCTRIDFDTDGWFQPIQGTPYIENDEYWFSDSVKIYAFPEVGTGFAPGDKARIYDTSYVTTPGGEGNVELGSPNEDCPDGGGPGQGVGGAPFTPQGITNVGANCVDEGKVLIIQDSDKAIAEANEDGGQIRFDFLNAITLNIVGLMNMQAGDKIEVHAEDGTIHTHEVNDYGPNSVEDLELYMKKVVKLIVFMSGPGAIRYIDYCDDCGLEEEMRELGVEDYYPPPEERDYENQDSVAVFEQKLADIKSNLSQILQDKITTDFLNDQTHCLYNKNVLVNVEFEISTPAGASNCNFR